MGRPPKRARLRLPTRWIFVAALLGMSAGCATLRPPVAAPDADSVGQLAAGPSVWHAPTHATTDLAPAFQAVATDDDSAAEVVTTVTRAPDAGEVDALPGCGSEVRWCDDWGRAR